MTLLYLVLHQKPVDQSILISENWPDDDEDAVRNNLRQSLFRLNNELGAYYNDVKLVVLNKEMIDFSDQVRVTTDADEMETFFTKARSMPDSEDKLAMLKQAFSLYRGRLFIQGEADIGTWLMGYTAHYNQVFVDITTELLRTLGHHKDFRCIMDYAPMALEKEPGMHEAYFWMVRASETMGNSVAKEKALEKAKEEQEEEEYKRLIHLLETASKDHSKRREG